MGISTHILDTASGRPVTDVPVLLEREEDKAWRQLHADRTDADGRCRQLLPADVRLETGVYRIRFETAGHYTRARVSGLYPYVEIVFEVRDAGEHYHIPLLLTANGYTTYRGS
jgi:5-hydroxyisourate hydrolase